MYSIESIFRILFGLFIIIMTVVTVLKKLRLMVKNRNGIHESLELLRSRLGEPREEYMPDPGLYESFLADNGNSGILTALAHDILYHCSKQPWNIPVHAAEKLDPHTAGQYVYNSERAEIRILIGDNVHGNIILSVLIHECIHHFLRTAGIDFEETYLNEVLTDTTALYMGFSKFMNGGYIGVGYLSCRELLYAEELICQGNVSTETSRRHV